MASKTVILEYLFLFNPDATWAHLYEFEKSLADFFAAHGMEAEVMSTIDGARGRRVLYISKIQEIPKPKKPEKLKTPKQMKEQVLKLK